MFNFQPSFTKDWLIDYHREGYKYANKQKYLISLFIFSICFLYSQNPADKNFICVNPSAAQRSFSASSTLTENQNKIDEIHSNQEIFEMRTNELEFNQFPKNINVPAFIEMNYANNYPFEVGILHKDNFIPSYVRQPLITFIPTYDFLDTVVWNKTYLYIPDATNFFPSATEFDLYLRIQNTDQQDDIRVRLDNIKVIFTWSFFF